jgi:multidrug resistance efflux pump
VIEWVRARPMAAAVKVLIVLTAVGAAVWGLFFVPTPTYVEADARLAPAQLATLSAPHGGEIREVLVETGERVEKGQPLLEVDKTDLQYQRSEILSKIAQQRWQKRAAERKRTASGNNSEPGSAPKLAELKIEGLQNRLDAVERRIDRSTVRSMIDGVVLSERPGQMEGINAAQGEKLIEVADMSHFDLIMEVEEADLALIEKRLRAGQAVPVNFLFRAWPDRMQHAKIRDVQAISPTSSPDERQKQHVFRVTVPVELEGLSPEMALANPTGRAKLQVQPHSIAYHYGRDFWRFIKVTLLF